MKKYLKYSRILLVILILIGLGRMIYLSQNGYVLANWSDLRDKSIWMILELLIVPTTLAIFVFILDKFERQEERKLNLDNQRERLLQNYFDALTGLILENGLKESKPNDEVREIARIKTLTTLKRLDTDRKGGLLEFLSETELIQMKNDSYPIISLDRANLAGARLRRAKMEGSRLVLAELEGAHLLWGNLKGANLRFAYLEDANLSDANLEGACLEGAHLEGANLEAAHLEGAVLRRAHMEGANLEDGFLDGVIMTSAHLEGANLRDAYLEGASLIGAHLEGADLEYAHLEGASLEGVEFQNAIMPDGKEYDPEIHTIEYLTGKKDSRGKNEK